MAVNLAQPADPLKNVVVGAQALGQAIKQGESDSNAIAIALGLAPPPAPPKPATDNGPLILIGGLLVLVGVVAVVLYVVRRKK